MVKVLLHLVIKTIEQLSFKLVGNHITLNTVRHKPK